MSCNRKVKRDMCLCNGDGFVQAGRGRVKQLPQLQVRQLLANHAQAHPAQELLAALQQRARSLCDAQLPFHGCCMRDW